MIKLYLSAAKAGFHNGRVYYVQYTNYTMYNIKYYAICMLVQYKRKQIYINTLFTIMFTTCFNNGE